MKEKHENELLKIGIRNQIKSREDSYKFDIQNEKMKLELLQYNNNMKQYTEQMKIRPLPIIIQLDKSQKSMDILKNQFNIPIGQNTPIDQNIPQINIQIIEDGP